MVASSTCLGAAGIACLFAPAESAAMLGRAGADPLIIQLLGSFYLALGYANWMARGSMIGGIYARPLSMLNFCHFLIGALVLAKEISPAEGFNPAHVVVTMVYVAFTVVFTLMLYGYLEPTRDSQ